MHITLIGGGKMGEALLSGWLHHGVSHDHICVVEPNDIQAGHLHKTYGVAARHDVRSEMHIRSDITVLAIKPQQMDTVLKECSVHLAHSGCYLSIAAGKSLDAMGKLVPDMPIIRAMPNLPATVGEGMTVMVGNPFVTEAQKKAAIGLMQAVGEVAWVNDEKMMDSVTAISGSGPAYVFYLAEILTEIGVEQGLPQSLAAQLACQTIKGSAMLLAESDKAAAALRQAVTSPGGTTEAALEILMQKEQLKKLFAQAVSAATARAKKLNN